MTQFANPAGNATAAAKAYTAAILTTLGSRDPVEVLTETPEALRQLVAGRSAAELARPEAPGKWSAAQVLRHLVDSELVAGFRIRMALTYDRPAIGSFDQDLWAERLHYEKTDAAAALEEFAVLRRMNLRLLQHTTPAEREREFLHFERGLESVAHTMRMYAGHDLVHRRQIERVLGG
jgi:hypothetical protein